MTAAGLRPQAEADLIERTRRYRREAGSAVAERFFDAAVAALRSRERMPGIGSPHVGELCDLPGLRFQRVAGFLCGWLYFERNDHLDVVRLIADAQDLEADSIGPATRAVSEKLRDEGELGGQ